MGWFTRLFNRTPAVPPPPEIESPDLTLTNEEQAAVSKHKRGINAFAPQPGLELQLAPALEAPFKALALVEHVRELLGLADQTAQADLPALFERMIKTQTKAYTMHRLPFYAYILGVLYGQKGDAETAKKLYAFFLSEQRKFRPTDADQWVIRFIQIDDWYEVDAAIADARKITAT
jgi:hypothetical protein